MLCPGSTSAGKSATASAASLFDGCVTLRHQWERLARADTSAITTTVTRWVEGAACRPNVTYLTPVGRLTEILSLMPKTEGPAKRGRICQTESCGGALMNEVITQAPTSSERLEIESNPQPFERRRLALMGAVFQSAPLRWWFAKRYRPRSDSDLAKVPIYPGA